MAKQPGQRTSIKKELGLWTRRFSLCLRFSSAASGWSKSAKGLGCENTSWTSRIRAEARSVQLLGPHRVLGGHRSNQRTY
jgi:hypothetical protein